MAATASAAPAPAASNQPTKVKLVIPKRAVPPPAADGGEPRPAAAAEATGAPIGGGSSTAPVDPTRAAALAVLRAKQQPAAERGQQASGQEAQQPKPPTLKRPSARPRPAPRQQLAAPFAAEGGPNSEAAAYQQQQQDQQQQDQRQEEIEPGSYYEGGDGIDEQVAKRQHVGEQAGAAEGEGEELEGNGHTCLFVGDLPGSWTTPDLADFFSSEFGGAVVEARVIGEQCYGFVTFADPADAENVLMFSQQQGVWAEDGMLRINWAQSKAHGEKKGGTGDGGDVPAVEHPRVIEARLQAQELAASVRGEQLAANAMLPPPERQLVSYEDL